MDDKIVHHGVHMKTKETYFSLGFRFENISYISDCNFIPEDTFMKLHGSELIALDSLFCMYMFIISSVILHDLFF